MFYYRRKKPVITVVQMASSVEQTGSLLILAILILTVMPSVSALPHPQRSQVLEIWTSKERIAAIHETCCFRNQWEISLFHM